MIRPPPKSPLFPSPPLSRSNQAPAIATATCLLEHGDAEFGAALVLGMRGKGQVRHGDQLEPAVVDAEDVIALEVELHGIAADLLVAGGIAGAQGAVALIQL